MHIKLGRNTSDVSGLINYLTKEDDLIDKQIKRLQKTEIEHKDEYINYLKEKNEQHREKEFFFNDKSTNIEDRDATFSIANNVKGLKKEEAHFYTMTISPSRRELNQLREVATTQAIVLGRRGDKVVEDQCMKNLLKQYAVNVMDAYARNFEREGINSSADLVWVGKVETDRYWKHDDWEVVKTKEALKNLKYVDHTNLYSDYSAGLVYCLKKDLPIIAGMPKNEDNHHIHIIVSRKDATQKISLSPLSKQRSSPNHKINGRECKVGFDRNAFANASEKLFDDKFEHQRWFSETFEAQKMKMELRKNPDPQKQALYTQMEKEHNRTVVHAKYASGEYTYSGGIYRRVKYNSKYVNYKSPVTQISKGLAKKLLSTAGLSIPVLTPIMAISKIALMAGGKMKDLTQEK